MRRNLSRPQFLYLGLVFLALMLFFVPDAHVDYLRGRALSALSPVLTRFAAQRHAQPMPALITVAVEEPKAPEPQPAEPSLSDYAKALKELDELRAAYIQLLSVCHGGAGVPAGRHGGQPHPPNQPAGINAHVIQRKVLWQEAIYGLGQGEADGVRLHAGVLHRGAVAGRIVAVGPRASSMALVTHRGMSITARLAECRLEGLLQGCRDDGEERLCRLKLIGRECGAKVGEHVVTSGFDGAFPPGLWLGDVTAIRKSGDMQWELTVQPACNESALEDVRVLTGRMPEIPWPAAPKKK